MGDNVKHGGLGGLGSLGSWGVGKALRSEAGSLTMEALWYLSFAGPQFPHLLVEESCEIPCMHPSWPGVESLCTKMLGCLTHPAVRWVGSILGP